MRSYGQDQPCYNTYNHYHPLPPPPTTTHLAPKLYGRMRVIDPFYLDFFIAIIYKAIETRDRKDQLRVYDRIALAQGGGKVMLQKSGHPPFFYTKINQNPAYSLKRKTTIQAS